MKIIDKEYFYVTLTQDDKVLPYYLSLKNNIDDTEFYISDESDNLKTIPNKGVSVSLFPTYLYPTFFNEDTVKVIKLPQSKITGYAIVIKEFCDVNEFLRNHYKKKFKDNILRLVNRFENCFTPTYKMFYGDICEENYTFLMNTLKKMLTKRFSQKTEEAHTLLNWDFYMKSSFSSINSKKASLYVIYINETPVQITLNNHYKNTLFVSIPSYDINLSKFALGNIAIYKLLEWALKNNHNLLDMAYGDLEYKRRWSNYTYNLEHHIVYKKGNPFVALRANLEALIIKVKNSLKSINIDTYIKGLKRNFKTKPIHNSLSNIKSSIILELPDNLIPINLESEESSLIIKNVYDFLYANKEHIKDINLFKNKSGDEFFIIGKNTKQKVNFA